MGAMGVVETGVVDVAETYDVGIAEVGAVDVAKIGVVGMAETGAAGVARMGAIGIIMFVAVLGSSGISMIKRMNM